VSNLLEAIYSRRRESAGRAITIICNVRIVDAFAMARGKVKIRPRRQGAHHECAGVYLAGLVHVCCLFDDDSSRTPLLDSEPVSYGRSGLRLLATKHRDRRKLLTGRHHHHSRLPSRNPIGWLFCAIGLFTAEYAIATLLAAPGSWLSALPGGEALAWVSSWVWVVHFGPFMFLALLFPDGRLPSPRWRPFASLVALVVLGGAVAVALWPGTAARFDSVTSPLGIDAAANVINPIETILYALALTAAASLLVRLIRSKGIERQQVKWFAFAVGMLAISTTLAYVVSEALDVFWLGWISSVLVIASMVSLPVAMSIAILRYRLYQMAASLIARSSTAHSRWFLRWCTPARS
jgi:hypothetical protein